jgi:hypothetical protein
MVMITVRIVHCNNHWLEHYRRTSGYLRGHIGVIPREEGVEEKQTVAVGGVVRPRYDEL